MHTLYIIGEIFIYISSQQQFYSNGNKSQAIFPNAGHNMLVFWSLWVSCVKLLQVFWL